MNPYAMFKTNPTAEVEQGITLDYGAFSIRIARAGGANRKFGQVLAQKLKPYRRQLENDTMDDAVASRLMAEAYAEAVVLGWDNVTDAQGNPMAFSRDACVQLLTDLPELFADIQEQSRRAANFRREERDDAAKN